jgi:hypothetical protein
MSKFTRVVVIIFHTFFSAGLFAQSLHGVVRARDNSEVLAGATVKLIPLQVEGTASVAISGADGVFHFGDLRPGYYHCEVSQQGFELIYFDEILIAAGKAPQLEVSLKRVLSSLPEVTVTASLPGRRPVQPLGEIPLSRDRMLRYPNMYFDPGRLATAYGGVAQVDDGTNQISVRGVSPAMVRWRLEGLDIINPNHLPNAGTFNDAPAAASGGVLMFSAQLLDNSSLLTGSYPAGYGDAAGGVMDMNLRAGNKYDREYTIQAGLIGLDIAAEGPLGKSNRTSYLVNYRYSTVGLLGAMGVSFGGEKITFQDFAFHLHTVGKKGGQYSVFGMGGLSSNIFTQRTDTSEIEYDKDRYNIDFRSLTGVVGGTAKWQLGRRTSLRAALAYSAQDNDWQKQRPELSSFAGRGTDKRYEERHSATVELRHSRGGSLFSAGAMATRIFFNGKVSYQEVPSYDSRFNYLNLQPWLRWDWTSGNGKLNTQAGAQFHYNTVYDKMVFGPRGTISYRADQHHKFSVSAGLYNQDAPAWAQQELVFNQPLPQPNYKLPYINSFQTGLRYVFTPDGQWKFSAELYRHTYSNIPAYSAYGTIFNSPEYIGYDAFLSTAQARNQGIEISADRVFMKGWYLLANATVFDSRYRIGDQETWLDSRWDIGYLGNLTFGKEIRKEKTASRVKVFGLGGRFVLAGGPRLADIDLAASGFSGRTVFDEADGYRASEDIYARMDVRFYWKKSTSNKKNTTFSIDLQNVTNRQNLSYRFYDAYTGRVENKYQLGLIPNISWRREF